MNGRCYNGKSAGGIKTTTSGICKTDRNISKCVSCICFVGVDSLTQRVSVVAAAKEIGCHPEYLRRQMKAGAWDLGNVVKPAAKGGNNEYFIFRTKLDKFLGKEGGAE